MDSLEIAVELTRLGFVLTVNNKHAKGYEHPLLPSRLFVKASKNDQPVKKQALLLHPEHAEKTYWPNLAQLSSTQPNLDYKNSNLTGFPRIPGSQQRRAIALDVACARNLRQTLYLMGLPADNTPNQTHALPSQDLALNQTEREALIKARIGQGFYRDQLVAYWGGCAITGCNTPALLRASHIKPWRAANGAERLDPFNGLLLIPNFDVAFDQGFISFDDHGQILISSNLAPDSACALNITPNLRLRQIDPRHRVYLAWHRDNLFRK